MSRNVAIGVSRSSSKPADHAVYRNLLAARCRTASVEVWAYCLMPRASHPRAAHGRWARAGHRRDPPAIYGLHKCSRAFRGGSLPTDARSWTALGVMAVMNSVLPATFIVWAQRQITSGLASILNVATPLFTVVVARLLIADEKISVRKIFGVLLGLSGVVLMIGIDALQGLGANVLAQAAMLAAALCYALAGVHGRAFRGMGLTPLATATGQLAAASFLLVPVSLIVDRPWSLPWPHLSVCASVLGSALLSTALAFVIYFRVLHNAGDERPAGDVSDPGQHHHPGHRGARRAARVAAFCRDGADRPRARRHRRPPAAPPAHVPRGLALRVGGAASGSSGQKCRGYRPFISALTAW